MINYLSKDYDLSVFQNYGSLISVKDPVSHISEKKKCEVMVMNLARQLNIMTSTKLCIQHVCLVKKCFCVYHPKHVTLKLPVTVFEVLSSVIVYVM